jgi:lysyl-tRNA synthetase class 2
MGESLEEIRRVRKGKADRFRAEGVDPYPDGVPRRIPIGTIRKKFSALSRAKKRTPAAGRITAIRGHGALIFADLRDDSGTIQILFKRDLLGGAYGTLTNFDAGDFIWVEGIPFRTKAGEETLEVRQFRMLAKAIRPIPAKWFGLDNVEERLRRRYLDLLVNDDVRERFRSRSKIVSLLRTLIEHEGFFEVETPILQPLYGGAAAHPFRTHHDLLDLDLYLRIAPELYLKRLLVGGFERIYEIGKSFRNEGIDREHAPEFTSLELYWAYQDREGMMVFLEKLMKRLARAIGKKDRGIFREWPRLTFDEAIRRAIGIAYGRASREELLKRAKAKGVGFAEEATLTKGKIGDEIVKKLFVPAVKDPIFLVDHPTEISPLAKHDPRQPQRALRFQAIAAGWEFANGFAELNDPEEQRRRFKEQERIRKMGEAEAMRYDEDFVEALEYGMPPAAGLGIGIDRLVAWLTDAPSLKEVILFPMLKPKTQ